MLHFTLHGQVEPDTVTPGWPWNNSSVAAAVALHGGKTPGPVRTCLAPLRQFPRTFAQACSNCRTRLGKAWSCHTLEQATVFVATSEKRLFHSPASARCSLSRTIFLVLLQTLPAPFSAVVSASGMHSSARLTFLSILACNSILSAGSPESIYCSKSRINVTTHLPYLDARPLGHHVSVTKGETAGKLRKISKVPACIGS